MKLIGNIIIGACILLASIFITTAIATKHDPTEHEYIILTGVYSEYNGVQNITHQSFYYTRTIHDIEDGYMTDQASSSTLNFIAGKEIE